MSKGHVEVARIYEAERIRSGQHRLFQTLEDAKLWVTVGLAGHVTLVEVDTTEPHEERRSVIFKL